MACDPHAQILSPCEDDAVSVAQVLGTRGEVNFDEYGTTALSAGQTEVDVKFIYEKISSAYVYEYLYVRSSESGPDEIRAVANTQDTLGFIAVLSGAPETANAILYWHVKVPDPLVVCQPADSPVQYAIIRPPQQGKTPLIQGQAFIEVTFPTTQADNLWRFLELEIETYDPDNQQIFAWVVTEHSTTGFRLELSGSPETIINLPDFDGGVTSSYKLSWRIA